MAWTFRQLRANSTAWLHRQAVGARAQHPTGLSEQEQGCRVSSKERLDEPLPALADQNALIGAAGITVTTASNSKRNRWPSGTTRSTERVPGGSDHDRKRRFRQREVDGASLLSSWSDQLRPSALGPCSCPICSADRSAAEFVNPSGATPPDRHSGQRSRRGSVAAGAGRLPEGRLLERLRQRRPPLQPGQQRPQPQQRGAALQRLRLEW